ncbi:MAG: hypothetical protein RR840_07705 [Clostridium sp.]
MNKKYKNEVYNFYFPIFTGVGLLFGVIFDQISIGICLGVALGLICDSNKAKSSN